MWARIVRPSAERSKPTVPDSKFFESARVSPLDIATVKPTSTSWPVKTASMRRESDETSSGTRPLTSGGILRLVRRRSALGASGSSAHSWYAGASSSRALKRSKTISFAPHTGFTAFLTVVMRCSSPPSAATT